MQRSKRTSDGGVSLMATRKSKRKTVGARSKRLSDKQASSKNGLLVVAVGASAGGIESFAELMNNLPADTGMAFVLIQHLDPKHHSLLTELIARHTKMAVEEVVDGAVVEPNHVYVIPPNATMTIANKTLRLVRREPSSGLHMPIDRFLRSLAETHGERAIGVILSGSGADGTLGMAEIRAHGGVTFAQEGATARYDGMPRSVIAAGCVDYVLPPGEIASELARIAQHPYVTKPSSEVEGDASLPHTAALTTIFQLLRRTAGVDFSHYRQTTILR